jgi:hypothetical protein
VSEKPGAREAGPVNKNETGGVMDGFHHAFKHRIEQLARLLGVAVGQQLHRALEVGEEDGNLLALALQGAP